MHKIPMQGREWVVDAYGCCARQLCSEEVISEILSEVVKDLGLTVLGSPLWHSFKGSGGITGLIMLTESHLTCHTFPEYGYAGFNLYCCIPRKEWKWKDRLGQALGATEVVVRSVRRGGTSPAARKDFRALSS